MDTTTEAKQTSHVVKLQDLERLIEFEIKQREDRERAQGWTPWLLAVGICALVWRLVESTESQNWPVVGLFWATTILLIDMVKSLSIWFTLDGSDSEYKPRFFAANWLLRGSRGHLVLAGTKIFCATVLVFCLGALPGLLRWSWLAYVVISAAGIPILLLLSYSDHGIKPPSLDSHLVIRVCMWFRWLLMSAVTVLLAILWWNCLDTSLTRESLKTALLMVGIAELTTLWSELKSGLGFRDSLVQLRRAIGLGELTVEDAKHRIDEVLHGAVTPQFLAKDIRVFDQAMTAYAKTQSEAHTTLMAVKATIAESARPPEETAAAIIELKAQVSNAQVKLEAVTKAHQRLLVRTGIVLGQSPNEMAEVKGLLQRLETNATAAVKSQGELKTSLEQIERDLYLPAFLPLNDPPVI